MNHKLSRLIEDVTIKSLANGDMLVETKYVAHEVDGEPHWPGILTRFSIICPKCGGRNCGEFAANRP